MPVRSKSGRIFGIPTPDEERVIRAGIADDPDAVELSDDALHRLRPLDHGEAKTPVSIGLSPEVLAFFKATGEGWRARIDAVLKQYVESRR